MIDLSQLLVLGLLSASIHWLIARAHITELFWANAHGWLGRLLRCPACTGWWLGLLLGLAGLRPFTLHYAWTAIVFSGVLATILTPVFEGVMLWGLEVSAIDEPEKRSVLDDNEDTTTPNDRPTAPPQS